MKIKTLESREEFERAVQGPGEKLVLFYSAWCPFCSSFMPDFEKAAAAGPGVFRILCVDEVPELEDFFSVEVVPTVLSFEDGKVARRLDGELGRGLSAEKLAAFIKKRGPGKGGK